MLTVIPAGQIYLGNYGWHTGRFHFSFGDYNDPENSHFGDLIAFNDFRLDPGSGFTTHPHSEIEIVTYCVEGKLTHRDSMGNLNTIMRGDMQYTCAGSGIYHSEINNSPDKPLRFIQIWIQPITGKLPPRYASNHFSRKDRVNKLLRIATGLESKGVIRVNQDANIYVTELEGGVELKTKLEPDRQYYSVCLEGTLEIRGFGLQEGDAIKLLDEDELTLKAVTNCHAIIIETIAREEE